MRDKTTTAAQCVVLTLAMLSDLGGNMNFAVFGLLLLIFLQLLIIEDKL